MSERLQQQIEFIREVDKLKSVLRQSYIMDQTRRENDAEHTWHITLMAWVLQEYIEPSEVNLIRVMKMLLVHDLVEIDAGDTFAYDEKGHEDKFEREQAAAKRIFGLLPKEQRDEMMLLWLEFEERETIEALYAASMDRIQPILHNYYTQGRSWKAHDVRSTQVLARIQFLRKDMPKLYEHIEKLMADAVRQGYIRS
ncbi:HD domain-containing protein [Paenibacillus pini]|uniref:Hydrolase n=1 Tax=Paenibacillus pini JCM 16418 TaxID=1236976 RepID=W7YQ37_9BACL|nr:HD domain-containing protein [Paenibacillus pini]GAF06691.1 hydrolase [Paenibacillus pini JCM 16418]